MGKDSFSKEEVMLLKPKTKSLLITLTPLSKHGLVMIPLTSLFRARKLCEKLKRQAKLLPDIDFNGRSAVGDDVDDLNDRNYGDNNVMPKNGVTGTHVSGIMAERNNNIGVN